MPFRGFRSTNRSQEVIEQVERGSRANLTAAAMIWHGGVIRELRGQRSGRVYQVPGTGRVEPVPVTVNVTSPRYKIQSYTRMQNKRTGGRVYTASAPGESPASRLGDLRTSYRYRVKSNYAEVGTPLKYGLTLEKGSRKMAPRPHLRKAYQVNRERIIAALGRNVI